MIISCDQLLIMAGSFCVRHLIVRGRNMVLAIEMMLLGSFHGLYATGATIKAYRVIYIGDVGDIDNCAVWYIMIMIPTAAIKAATIVPATIMNAAIITNMLPPIPFAPEELILIPCPISRSPK